MLFVNTHHIASDGWSMGLFVDELAALYTAFARGETSPLPELTIRYTDFAAWQRSWLSGEELERQVRYWVDHLSGAPATLELPTDRARPAARTLLGAHHQRPLSAELTALTRDVSREEGATLFMTLLSAFSVLLGRYAGQDDVVVGTPIANRRHRETEGLIGFFVNTLALQVRPGTAASFVDLLGDVRRTTLDAYAHQDLPFEKLVDELAPERRLDTTPVFQAMLVLHNEPKTSIELPELTLEPLEVPAQTAEFDLSLSLVEAPSGIVARLEYACELWDTATAQRFLGYFEALLAATLAEPQRPLRDLNLLGAGERHQLLVEWSDRSSPRGDLLPALLERQVAATPDAMAIVDGERALTYGEFGNRSAALASHLRALGAAPEVKIGLFLERSPELIIAMSGVLESGATFVPLDPAHPVERLETLIEDAAVALLVTCAELENELPGLALPTVRLGADSVLPTPPDDLAPAALTPQHAAYAIYTSGSTGKPKGVVVSHGSIAACIADSARAYRVAPGERMLHFASISFDGGLEEIFPPLIHGGVLHLRSDDMLDAAGYLEACRRLRLAIVMPPTAFWHEVVAALEAGLEWPEHVRLVMFGGEAPSPERLAAWHRLVPTGVVLINGYGPTEATVIATRRHLTPDLETAAAVPVGRPNATGYGYVLDPHGRPVPAGVIGELHLGGGGLARGYLDRPARTAVSFVSDPFAGTGARLYKTGDLARMRHGGDLEYRGRSDRQVKLRGFRVELGEVEAKLTAHPSVAEAVALVRGQDSRQQLVAWIVPAAGTPSNATELREYLSRRLPPFMVPAAIVTLETLPAAASGKIDREALRMPELGSKETVPPRNTVERDLAEIWTGVLGIEAVGIHDNFFELGGDSILSIQVVSRAAAQGWRITPRDLFQHPTVAGLARVAEAVSPGAADEGPVEGGVHLTAIQRGFFELEMPRREHFNQALLLEVDEQATGIELPAELFRNALNRILVHHDALRMRFEPPATPDAPWRQVNPGAAQGPDGFVEIDLKALPTAMRANAIESAARRLQRSLDLTRGPLGRMAFFLLGAGGSARLLWILHHLVVDGVSWRVLLEDLESLVRQAARNQALVLPARTSSFQRWSEHLRNYAGSPAFADQRAFWRHRLILPVTPLPVDRRERPALQATEATAHVRLDAARTRALLEEVPRAYRARPNEALLAVLALACAEWTGSPYLLVDHEGHGREALGEDALDVSRTVGWFTAIYPVRLDVEGLTAPEDVGRALMAVKEQFREIPDGGLGYGLLSEDDLADLPKAEVAFNYLGQTDQAVATERIFRRTAESAGATHDAQLPLTHLLTVNGGVSGGCLSPVLGIQHRALRARDDRGARRRFPGNPAAADRPLRGPTGRHLYAFGLPPGSPESGRARRARGPRSHRRRPGGVAAAGRAALPHPVGARVRHLRRAARHDPRRRRRRDVPGECLAPRHRAARRVASRLRPTRIRCLSRSHAASGPPHHRDGLDPARLAPPRRPAPGRSARSLPSRGPPQRLRPRCGAPGTADLDPARRGHLPGDPEPSPRPARRLVDADPHARGLHPL